MNRLGADIQEATIVSEESTPLADSGLNDNAGIKWVARQADRLSSGNRGSWVTEALILADYAKDDTQLRKAYKNGDAKIDQYFQHVDFQKIINEVGPDTAERVKTGLVDLVRNNVPGFLLGSIVTAGIIIAMKQKADNA